jgi:hypothetical protein
MTKKSQRERDMELMKKVSDDPDFTARWRAMWADRESWTDAMKAAFVRRKTAVDACIAALAELDDEDPTSSRTGCATSGMSKRGRSIPLRSANGDGRPLRENLFLVRARSRIMTAAPIEQYRLNSIETK